MATLFSKFLDLQKGNSSVDILQVGRLCLLGCTVPAHSRLPKLLFYACSDHKQASIATNMYVVIESRQAKELHPEKVVIKR